MKAVKVVIVRFFVLLTSALLFSYFACKAPLVLGAAPKQEPIPQPPKIQEQDSFRPSSVRPEEPYGAAEEDEQDSLGDSGFDEEDLDEEDDSEDEED